jgi:CheY-like chemotaxis protein
VRLTIADDGPGIAPEVRDRIFEPFVTTKSKQGSTGLGLAWLRGMAKQSGGEARIASTPGFGTTVALLLPIAGDADPKATDEPFPRGDGETVLVVEGERARRETDAAVLEGCGWTVLRAADAEEAAAALSAHTGPPPVAVVASFLPRSDGTHVASLLEALRPGTRTVLVVGTIPFASSTVGTRPVLQRPYSWGALARAVRDTFDSPKQS